MLALKEKIEILKNYLLEIKENYSDSFKTDIYFYFDEFENLDERFYFLEKFKTKEEIHNLVDNLISKIVMKFNGKEEQLSDFIFYELN